MCSSIFLVLGSSIERYLAVCRPHHYRNVSQKTSFIFINIKLSIGSLIFKQKLRSIGNSAIHAMVFQLIN